jgi:hypothetical protein
MWRPHGAIIAAALVFPSFVWAVDERFDPIWGRSSSQQLRSADRVGHNGELLVADRSSGYVNFCAFFHRVPTGGQDHCVFGTMLQNPHHRRIRAGTGNAYLLLSDGKGALYVGFQEQPLHIFRHKPDRTLGAVLR